MFDSVSRVFNLLNIAFIAAISYHYSVPEFVRQSGDPRVMGVLYGIVEAYTGERGFMGVHSYKVFGISEFSPEY
ncbi:hypothetical protein LX36DRAFT_753284 [Colletotrichum falcatum]|nr:hypothetical protein LX36DRAFT_753284 [Colletotrichum falcatum]